MTLEPDWIPDALRAARTFKAVTHGQAGARHFVYVVLLHDPRRRQAGYKSSSSARRFGVCLLPQLVEHLNPMQQWESLDLEAALAEEFRAIGVPWVEGRH